MKDAITRHTYDEKRLTKSVCRRGSELGNWNKARIPTDSVRIVTTFAREKAEKSCLHRGARSGDAPVLTEQECVVCDAWEQHINMGTR